MNIYQKYHGCLARPNFNLNFEDKEIKSKDILIEYEKENISVSGCVNYNLLIKDSTNDKFVFNLWFAYSGNVDSIFARPDQVELYDNEYDKIKREVNQCNEQIEKNKNDCVHFNGELKQIHSLWFMHRSVDEIYSLMKMSDFPINTTAMSYMSYMTKNKK